MKFDPIRDHPIQQTFYIPDTGLRSGSREFSHVSHESEVSPLLGGESRHKAEFGDEVHKRRLMTHFRRSLLGTFQPITREKGYFIGLPFTPLHLHVYNIVKNSKDLRHSARSRKIWHSSRSKTLVIIKQFFLQLLFNILLSNYKTKRINAKSVLVS